MKKRREERALEKAQHEEEMVSTVCDKARLLFFYFLGEINDFFYIGRDNF